MANNFPFPLSLAIWAHILAGSLALFCFTIPLFTRKGGKIHARSGWVYAGAMVVVALSAFLITPWRYFVDPEGTDRTRAFAFFLFFIALFSLTSLQQGIFVFRFKKRVGAVVSIGSIGFPVLLILVSALTLIKGLASQNGLFVLFALLAGRTAIKQINYWRNPPLQSKDWWFFHLENMFTCCIATVTAFAVTALPRIFPQAHFDSIWVWLAPTFILVPWMIWFTRKYELQFGL
ncbi:MAG: DUF2306 domain-containing protein [Bdellovibrionaceae bacterium]|nr:DUF2306 domain-containing protein [Pseudobdellovibrionaceae bacterium]